MKKALDAEILMAFISGIVKIIITLGKEGNIMNEYFINDGVSNEQRDFFHKVLDIGIDFISGDDRDGRPLHYATNNELRRKFSESIPSYGLEDSEVISLLEKVCHFSVSQSNHRFLAFPDSAGSVATYAADIISSFLNQNLIAIERSAPAATFIEAQLIHWLRFLIGYENDSYNAAESLSTLGGMWTSGGNMSNHIAIVTALLHKFPEIVQTGLVGLKRRPVLILAKGVAHYSFLNAAKVLGLGSDNVMWLDTDKNFRTDINSLVRFLDQCPSDLDPFMVVAVAGNCRTSSLDNIEALYDICQKNKIWFHVDACHGGSLLFSKKLRGLLKGIERADSVTIDPHKGLFVTYSSSYVLFKDANVLNVYCRYNNVVNDNSVYDLGLITPFYGSRGFESLKLWLLIKQMGLRKIGEYIEKRSETYLKIIQELEKTELFVFFNEKELYRSAGVLFPKKIREYCKRTCMNKSHIISTIQLSSQIFSTKLYARGNVIFDIFKLNDYSNVLGFGDDISYNVIGISVGHISISDEEMKSIINEIVDVSKEVITQVWNIKENSSLVSCTSSEDIYKGTSPASW